VAAAVALAVVLTSLALAVEQALVVVPGGSHVLGFVGMKRVVIVDPTIADVVVASKRELIVFGKSTGDTKLYVWDAAGRHEFAVEVQGRPSATLLVRRLRDLLPSCVTVKALDDKMILVTGVCASSAEKTRVTDIAKKVAGDVRIVDVISVLGEETSPAERTQAQLRVLLGSQYEYQTWGDKTVIVRGPMSEKTMADMKQITEGLGGDCKVVLVRAPAAGQGPPLTEIAEAVGKEYKVWMLPSGVVVVEGEAPTQAALDRVKGLVQAFEDRATVLALVTLAPEPKVSAQTCADLLGPALGPGLSAKAVGDGVVTIEGTVTDEAAAKRVTDLVSAVAKDVRVLNLVKVVAPEKKRIVVHVKVLDMNRDAARKYGVEWGKIVSGDYSDQPWAAYVYEPLNVRDGGVNPFGVNLHALETRNVAKILAEPNIVVNDGEEANILVGGEIPIPIIQPGGGGGGASAITIEYKPYGVTLKVRPEITESGMIKTKVEPEVSTVDYSKGVTLSGFVIPGVATRRSSTTVTMAPGGTLVIGGLIREDEYQIVKQIPLLSKLPIIGELFKSHETGKTKSELVIFLSPEILPDAEETKSQQ
jgi:Flp pilus assembly secretin CpaC